tara:strand:+ start:608 stop:862 length:255 start_codon:yes stop_codon:yes gene_type:complete
MNTNQRKSSPFLTKFEKTRALCIRAQQLANGSPTTLSVIPTHMRNVDEIAREEFRHNKLPIIIRRVHPNGEHEDWPIHELTYLA